MNIAVTLISAIGTNRTSYILTFIATSLWFISCTMIAQNNNISFGIINVWRGFLLVFVSYIVIRYQKQDPYIKSSQDNKYLFYRGSLQTINAMVFQISLRYLPNPIVQTLSNSGPIIVIILDSHINNRKINKNQITGTAIASISLLLTIYSSSLEQKQSEFHYIQSSVYGKIFIIMITFASLIGWAFGMIAIKKIKRKGYIIITYQTGLWSLMLGGLYSVFQQKSYSFDFEGCVWLLVIGGLMTASGFIYVKGLRLTENIGVCTLINFVTVIEAYFLSYFRYGEGLSVLGVVGSVGIFASLLYLTKQ